MNLVGTCAECEETEPLSFDLYCSGTYCGMVCHYCAFELSECGYDVKAIES